MVECISGSAYLKDNQVNCSTWNLMLWPPVEVLNFRILQSGLWRLLFLTCDYCTQLHLLWLHKKLVLLQFILLFIIIMLTCSKRTLQFTHFTVLIPSFHTVSSDFKSVPDILPVLLSEKLPTRYKLTLTEQATNNFKRYLSVPSFDSKYYIIIKT